MIARFALLLPLFLTPAFAMAADTVPPPRIDYHQHLLSPAVERLTHPAPRIVALPPDLARVLDTHSAHWNDKAGLLSLYADNAFVLTTIDDAPLNGRDAVAGFVATRFRAGYRMKAGAFAVSGNTGGISGYFERGDGDAAKMFGFFHLTLVKDASGDWQIAGETLIFPGPVHPDVETAKDLVAALDDAGIQKAVVLSDAYFFDSPRLTPNGGSYDAVRAENDWTAEQVAQFPDRLVAFCSLNPLSEYAIRELRRCAASGRFKGLKLHFGVSGVDLLNAAHVAKVRAVVAEANRLKLSLTVHVRADPKNYGTAQAQVLIDKIVSAAPDVTFTIAHLWGGEGFSADALAVYAQRVAAHDPHTKNLYFDLAELNVVIGDSPDDLKLAAQSMREIGLDRILYGTDGPIAESQMPRAGWLGTRAKLPLTDAEFATIAGNVAPFMR